MHAREKRETRKDGPATGANLRDARRRNSTSTYTRNLQKTKKDNMDEKTEKAEGGKNKLKQRKQTYGQGGKKQESRGGEKRAASEPLVGSRGGK